MKGNKPFKLVYLLLSLPLPLITQVNWNAPESLDAKKGQISTASGRAVVVTANPLASDAALRTLEKGGTAMDAVITAQTVLSVVEPQSSGLGGGAFLLYWDQTNKSLYALDGRETASAKVEEDMWTRSNGRPIGWLNATRSLSSIGVPGTTALLWEGHQQFGRLSWKSNFMESIRLAKGGFMPSPRFLRSISLAKKIGIDHSQAFKSLYLPNGSLPSPKKLFKNQQLAATLNRISKRGSKDFYLGEVANALIADLQQEQHNKPQQTITSEDLTSYRVQKRKPLCRKYRSWRVCTFPPPSGGGVAVLQALGTYELLSKKSWSEETTNHWHLLAESLRFADADRSHWIGDPIDWPVPLKGLLEDDYLRRRANAIKLNNTKLRPLPGRPKGSKLLDLASQPRTAGGGTTHLVVVDKDGNVASYTGSVETVFGSRYMSGGMVLNNQLTDFSFLSNISGKPIANRIGPNKRPMSSMSPVIVFQDGRPVLALGSPGGWLIPHYIANALIRTLDLKLTPKQAVSQKMISVTPKYTVLEKNGKWTRTYADIYKGLKSRGHQIKYSNFSSGLALIFWDNGAWHGSADPRREGKAVSLP